MLNNSDKSLKNDPSGVIAFLEWDWSDERNSVSTVISAAADGIFWVNGPMHVGRVDVHSIVEDLISALPRYIHQGYSIAVEPFFLGRGKCAVIQDATGQRIGILERPGDKINGRRLRH
jgi:hypothetical protein